MDKKRLIEAGIDYDGGVARLGDAGFYEKMLARVPEDPSFDQMMAGFAANDVHAAFEGAHALKGVSGNLNLADVSNAVVPLVEALRSDDLAKAKTLLPPVESAHRRLLAALRAEQAAL